MFRWHDFIYEDLKIQYSINWRKPCNHSLPLLIDSTRRQPLMCEKFSSLEAWEACPHIIIFKFTDGQNLITWKRKNWGITPQIRQHKLWKVVTFLFHRNHFPTTSNILCTFYKQSLSPRQDCGFYHQFLVNDKRCKYKVEFLVISTRKWQKSFCWKIKT